MRPQLDYPFLRAYALSINVHPERAKEMLTKARNEQPPEDALYFDQTRDRWVTFEELPDEASKTLVMSMKMSLEERHKTWH